LWHLQIVGNNHRWLQLPHPQIATKLFAHAEKWDKAHEANKAKTDISIEGRLTGAHLNLIELCQNLPIGNFLASYDIIALRDALSKENPSFANNYPVHGCRHRLAF
jgi:hypothetical protein